MLVICTGTNTIQGWNGIFECLIKPMERYAGVATKIRTVPTYRIFFSLFTVNTRSCQSFRMVKRMKGEKREEGRMWDFTTIRPFVGYFAFPMQWKKMFWRGVLKSYNFRAQHK